MKIAFISDVHGVPSTLERALAVADGLGAERLALLGDLLYHGPRNGVPNFYDPVKVASLLNGRKSSIVAVRGNCDTEVDQMMLEFPMMADYAEIWADDRLFFLTHGHIWNESRLPPLPKGAVLCHGHTHVPVNFPLPDGTRIFNPGSISLPKGGSQRSMGFWDGVSLRHVQIS